MTAIAFPAGAAAPESAARIRRALRDRGVVVATGALEGRSFLRVSAQLYNQRSDYSRCAEALAGCGLLDEIPQPA